MTGRPRADISARWFRILLRFYPPDFRDEMGESLVETYRDRCRAARERRGPAAVAVVWFRALADSIRNGLAERARPAAWWRRSGNWGRDMELATRRLVRGPLFVFAIVGTLTVGLGAFAVVFTVVQKVLLEPLPYREPDDLYFVWRNYTWFQFERGWLGGTDVAELQNAGGVIESAAGMLRGRVTLSGPADRDPTEISLLLTSPNLFPLLGATPMLGRGFAPNEAGPDRPALVVLSYELWNRLGGDPGILDTDLRLNGEPFRVIGVMPPGFRFLRHASLGPPQPADAYIPLAVDLASTNPNAGSYAGLVRVRPGTAPEVVRTAVAAVGKTIDERDFGSRGLELYPVAIHTDLVAGVRPALVVLGLAGGFLVMVLMVNLATLLLARAAQREQEFAVSRALGANRIALVRATLLEGGMLGLLGGIAAAAAAVGGTQVLVGLAPLDLPRRDTIAVDWSIGGMVVGLGLALGLLAAMLPAAWAARASLASLLSASAVRGGGGHGRLRRAMVVVQVALSLVLLSTGGLVVRSFERLLRADPGFEPEGVLTVRVPIPAQVFPEDSVAVARAGTPEQPVAIGIQDRLQAELAALPGVTAVSAADALPLTANANQSAMSIPGAPGNTGDPDHDRPLVDYIGIRAGYLEVMGIRILAGRGFHDAREPGVREALIDQVLARHFFPNANPLGARIGFDGDSLLVVGVFQQARLYNVHRDERGQLMIRAEDWGYRTLSWAVRSGRDPRSLLPEVRAAVRRVDPRLAIAEVRTLDQIVGDSLRQQRISAVLIVGFSLGALLLAAMGVFGVVAAAVTRRRHEIAVRLALGADYGRVLRLLLGEGARLVLLGVLIGVPGTWLAGRAIQGVLVGISPSDPATLAGVGVGLAAVALGACYLPARRVLGIEPARSLRQE